MRSAGLGIARACSVVVGRVRAVFVKDMLLYYICIVIFFSACLCIFCNYFIKDKDNKNIM